MNLGDLAKKKRKLEAQTAASGIGGGGGGGPNNPYLTRPVDPARSLCQFLKQVRASALSYLPKESRTLPITQPFCEVEVRLGILQVPRSLPGRRVTSTGAKRVRGKVAHAFDCSSNNATNNNHMGCQMQSGVSRSHFVKWTSSGISEMGPLAEALGVKATGTSKEQLDKLKRDLAEQLVETEYVETVYSGYAQERRVCFPGHHPPTAPPTKALIGKYESKEKLLTMDLTIPAANYDIRCSLSSEKIMDSNVVNNPPNGHNRKRIKRRRSYTTRDRRRFAWQIDVTEVTTVSTTSTAASSTDATTVDFEIEMELRETALLDLINETNEQKLQQMAYGYASQLWWIISTINPTHDVIDVEETLQDHPNKQAVQLALATCGALKRFMDSGRGDVQQYDCPIGKSTPPSPSLSNLNFIGCMPVNFSRHNLEEIQKSENNAYYLSEKTDGVRYFLIFTGLGTAVLVDRAMRGKQPIPIGGDKSKDPFAPILDLIQPGTVLDGEVVMNRRSKESSGSSSQARPVFIVFDVLAVSTTQPVLHLPFEQRFRHLRQATFRTRTAARDMFDARAVADPSIALPLVRKNFVKRTDLDELLSHVKEEHGLRCYRNGDLHNHLTDGIIFQPNTPYVCGTDRKLLKWKYLDTVTIDVEMLPLRPMDDDDTFRVGCLGEEQTRVDMTRYILLPKSERMRLEADKFESGGRIAEVGFDPETGEWYYLTMRSDKIMPNHISTVLGTLLELAENLSTDELRYRMSVPAGARDTYRKDMRGMLKQLLEFQRRRLASSRSSSGGGR